MDTQARYRKSLFISIVWHVVVFLVLAMGFQFTGKNFVVENSNMPNVINAVVMNPTPSSPLPSPPAIKPPPVIPVEKPQEMPKKEVIAIDDKKQKKLQQEKIQQQLLADLKKIKAHEKQLKQKALETAFEKEIKNLSAKTAQTQNTQKRVSAEQEQKAQGIVDKYKALILQTIGQHWLIPANVDKTVATQLLIFLAPGGTVVDVQIYKSSGNVALDNSARAAVFKASPLPVPSNAEEFKAFRRFVLVCRPMYFQAE